MRLTDITAIGRAIDFRYPTNRAIVVLAVVTVAGGAATQILGGAQASEALGWGVRAGWAVFFAWALAREVDPDHDLSAFVAAGLMLAVAFFSNETDLLGMLWWLVALRVVNRSPGLPARVLDSAGLLALGGWLAWRTGWTYGLWTTAAFLLDGLLRTALRRHIVLAAAALLVTGGIVGFEPPTQGLAGGHAAADLSLVVEAALGVSGLLFALVPVTTRRVGARGDHTGEPLDPGRVRAGQVLVLAAAAVGACLGGRGAVVAWLPLWAAMLGAGLYRLGWIARGPAGGPDKPRGRGGTG